MIFTDHLDNPINAGDVITYPVAWGSSSANINLAKVVEVDPIVKSQDGRWRYLRNDHKSPSKRGYGISYPKRALPGPDPSGRGRWGLVDDPEKAYRLVVNRIRENGTALKTGKAYDDPNREVYLTNVDRVVVITSIYRPRPEDPHQDG